jgi:hypothetical protein
MEAEGLSLCSQKLATVFILSHMTSLHIPILFVGPIYTKVFKMISFLLVFTRNPVCISLSSNAFRVPHFCHPP